MTPDALAALHFRCFETPRPWSADEFADLLGMTGVFLCLSDAGFALGRVIADEAELLTIAVAPEARRRGEGQRLLAEFEAESTRRGAISAFLEVNAANPAAIAFYERTGYSRNGLRKGYYQAPDKARIDAMLYRKHLA